MFIDSSKIDMYVFQILMVHIFDGLTKLLKPTQLQTNQMRMGWQSKFLDTNLLHHHSSLLVINLNYWYFVGEDSGMRASPVRRST